MPIAAIRVCAFDVGTSGVKAGYFCGDELRAATTVTLKTQTRANHVEMRGHDVLHAINKAVRTLCVEFGQPDCLAYDTFSTGLVLYDDHAKPLSPIFTHQDRRSIAAARDIVAHFGEKHLLNTVANLPYPGGIGASTLRWLCQNDRAILRRARVGQTSSLIAAHLTGRHIIDPSQAAFTGLYNFKRRTWADDIARYVGVTAAQLPEIVWADTIVGRLRDSVARALHIRPGTPLIGGFVDTSAAVMLTPMHAGQLVHNSGSTDVLALCLDKPRPAAHYLSRPVGVGAIHPPRWLAASTIAAAGAAIEWLRQTMFCELPLDDYYHRLAAACKSPASPLEFTTGLAGSRTAIEQPTALLKGLSLSTTRDDIMRALAASLTAESARRYADLAALTTIAPRVFTIGKASTLASAMHRAWPSRHTFTAIKGDALAGLNVLAQRVMSH